LFLLTVLKKYEHMISASAALFQTATKGIGAVTARAEALAWQALLSLNFFGIGKYHSVACGNECCACRSYDNLLLFRKLPSEKELLKPHFDSDLSIVL
jgi:hypothetical protein